MTTFVQKELLHRHLRLPLSGAIDLTYRCNNHCRHCWLWLAPGSPEKARELSFEEIRSIVDAARSLGCRQWSMSGGEPMLRPDFAEIFDYITARSLGYTLNSNGTFITPEIAQLLKRKGTKMIAIYGATAEVHDHVTRNPGGFEATMRGCAYLKEAGAGFVVQVIPMKDNYHQLDDMLRLAATLSPHYRIGAAWLYLSASGNEHINGEIGRQRLTPQQVIDLDKPDMSWQDAGTGEYAHPDNDCLFTSCVLGKQEFHIDPCGSMSFCGFIKVPALRYNLRCGSFREAWETFLPGLAAAVKTNDEYRQGCGSCDRRADCRWCPVYGYLEHQRFTAKVEYLCSVAAANRAYKDNWLTNHRRFYECAGMTIQVDSDLPITSDTFVPKFQCFTAAGPGNDNITIRHYFSLPDIKIEELGRPLYERAPWAIYRKGESWVYLGISPSSSPTPYHQVAIFNHDHSRGRIYNLRAEAFAKGHLHSLTMFPTDQILIGRLLADRQACYLHSSGVVLDGQGLLFAGHSEAGKSTTVKMLRSQGAQVQILCDDRNIVRRWPEGFRLHGTWSHGEVSDVSNGSAPLRAILFLVKDSENRLVPLTDRREVSRKLLACLIKPFVTADWWEKTLAVVEQIAQEVPCYDMHFDKSGQIVDVLRRELL